MTTVPLTHRGRHWRLGAQAFLLAALGCARFRSLELPSDPAHCRENRQEKSGLTVAAQLIVDPAVMGYHFGPDVHAAGYFPVILRLENRSENSFEFHRRNFKVILEDGETFEAVSPLEVLENTRRSHLLTYLLSPLILPAVLAHASTEDYNFELARSLEMKSLPKSLRLEGQDPPVTKALFFRDPARSRRASQEFQGSVLQFLVSVEGTREAEAEDLRSSGAREIVGKVHSFTVSLAREDSP